MRIVLLTAGVRGIGSYCINLYHRLRAEGHEVLLISERKWEKQPLESFYQARSFMFLGVAPFVYRPAALVRAIVAFKPDLIHYHWPCGTMDLLFGRIVRLHIPVLVTIHVSLASREHFLDKCWYFYFTLYRRWIPYAQAVNCISGFVKRQLQTRSQLPEGKTKQIYAGVDDELFNPSLREERASHSSEIELLFVGQIMPEKGIDMLVRAFIEVAKLRDDLHLTIVGHGPLERKLRFLSRKTPSIRWKGFLSGREEVARHYANADVTVLPTRWDEAFSLVPIESFSCGTPVIATARGGTPEQITDGITGYLLYEGGSEELTRRLLALEKSELLSMRPACRELVLKRHTMAMMGEKHIALYREILEGVGTPSA